MEKGVHGRKDRLIKERRHDVYQAREKWAEPTECTSCGAVFAGGRWQWQKAGNHAHKTTCPACRRTAEGFPAGQLRLSGEFFDQHREEVINLTRNIESQERAQHPMERVMAVTQESDHTLITTTGIHVARRIAEAVSHAYKGELSLQYADADQSVRITWSR